MIRKKKIQIKLSFKSRLELFFLKIELFGVRRLRKQDFKDLFFPKKLEALFG